MPSLKLTARTIESAKPPTSGRLELWDAVVSGLGLRVTPNGVKTWVLRYRAANGAHRRLKLGRFPDFALSDAREEAGRIKRAVALGDDPAGEKRETRKAMTFAELAALYIEKYARPNKRSWYDDQRYLERKFVPTLGKRVALEIKRTNIRQILIDIRDGGSPQAANKAHAIIRRVYTWAIAEAPGFEEMTNPARDIPRIAPPVERDRVLTAAEIKAVWETLDIEPDPLAARYRLQLLLAQRGGEIGQMRGDQIQQEIEGPVWTIPAGVAKSGKSHRVPLTRAAVAVILETAGADNIADLPEGYLFPNPHTGEPYVKPRRVYQRLRQHTGIDFRPHDLRRSAATNMASMGVAPHIVSKVLGHADPGDGAAKVTQIYNRFGYDKEKRAALEQWADRLAVIVRGDMGQVVPMEAHE